MTTSEFFAKYAHYIYRGEASGCILWFGPRDKRHRCIVELEHNKSLLVRTVVFECEHPDIIVNEAYSVVHKNNSCAKSCINPHHLTLAPKLGRVPVLTDELLEKYARITHCHYGHEFTPENTGFKGTYRFCKLCTSPHGKAMIKFLKGSKEEYLIDFIKQHTPRSG